MKILRRAKEIDFKLMYSGKICFDELNRIKRLRRVSIKLPHFAHDIAAYRHSLREIYHINGLQPAVIINCVYQNPIIQEKIARTHGHKRSSSYQKFRDRKCNGGSVRQEARKSSDKFISCEIFPIKSPLKRVQQKL